MPQGTNRRSFVRQAVAGAVLAPLAGRLARAAGFASGWRSRSSPWTRSTRSAWR